MERRRQEWDHDGGWESSASSDRLMEQTERPSVLCRPSGSVCGRESRDDPGATQEVAGPSLEGSAQAEQP